MSPFVGHHPYAIRWPQGQAKAQLHDTFWTWSQAEAVLPV